MLPLDKYSFEEPSCLLSAHSGYFDPQAGRGPCQRLEGRGKRGSAETGSPKRPPCHNLRVPGRQLTLGNSWGKEGWLRRSRGPGPGPGAVSCVWVQLVQGILSPVSSVVQPPCVAAVRCQGDASSCEWHAESRRVPGSSASGCR